MVLPEPLLPKKPNTSPLFTVNDKSLITVLLPKSMRKWSIDTNACALSIESIVAEFLEREGLQACNIYLFML